MMDTDFLLEKKLALDDPELSQKFRCIVAVMAQKLQQTETLFPDFTDHTMRHVTFVTQFCNTLIGRENIERLNMDEVFILLSATVFHDWGMCITDKEYQTYASPLVGRDYFSLHPQKTVRDAVREYHQDISAHLVRLFADIFEFPSEAHAYCVAQVVRGHRRTDLLNEENFSPACPLPNGNTVCLPYLAAVIRLADEMNIAEDRNALISYEEHPDIIAYKQHHATKHLRILEDHFEIEVSTRDPEVLANCQTAIQKLSDTLQYTKTVIETKTSFTFPWNSVKTIFI